MFKKSDAVYEISTCTTGSVRIRELTIQSWGAKRGTATISQNGRNVRHEINVQQVNKPLVAESGMFTGATHIFKVSEVTREFVEGVALANGNTALEFTRASLVRNSQNSNAGDAYRAAMLKKLAEVPAAPTVAWIA